MNSTIKNKNKRKHMIISKQKTKTNEPVWHWLQYADIMFEFILLPVVMLLAFANINRILLLLVIPASILLGVIQSALIINEFNRNDKIICFISTSIIYALMLSNANTGLQVIGLSIMSIIIGWISTYIAYIISIKKRNANNNASTANTTTVNNSMSDNTYYTV